MTSLEMNRSNTVLLLFLLVVIVPHHTSGFWSVMEKRKFGVQVFLGKDIINLCQLQSLVASQISSTQLKIDGRRLAIKPLGSFYYFSKKLGDTRSEL